VISMSDVAICWWVWVALVGGVTGCSVVQWWVVLWAVGLLCWEGKCTIGRLAGSLVGG
jgi:hypothetical protein